MVFVDGALDDPDALFTIDHVLQDIAWRGADVRRAERAAAEVLDGLTPGDRPRAMLAAGPAARTLRTVLEPTSPVPVIAWPYAALPGWVGSLDLVVLACGTGTEERVVAVAAEAHRRGCSILVCAPAASPLLEASGHGALVIPAGSEHTATLAVPVLDALHRLALGPAVEPDQVADALDAVALRCGPGAHTEDNPAKQLALTLADDIPLVWGGSILAARATSEVAEMLRHATGRPAVAGAEGQIRPLLEQAPERDVFADPFESDPGASRPAMLVLDDGTSSDAVQAAHNRLLDTAEQAGVRVGTARADAGSESAQLASLLAIGRYVATYLALGLGRSSD